MSHIKPENAGQLEEAIKWALSEEESMEIIGSGSKQRLGRPVKASHKLDLSALTGITLYEPEELVLSARAGTSLNEIQDELAKHNQYMAFEPMDYGALFKGEADAGTLGGMIACNLSGPRRLKAGAARDHFLGFSGVSGRGETFKSGGRVVKNVTGYDLMKLMAGSYGTLAVMSDITIKVLPAPPEEKSYILYGLSDGEANRAMSVALNSSCEVSSAAHIPQIVSDKLTQEAEERAMTVLRLEGHGPSIAYRADKLASLLADFGTGSLIAGQQSRSLWQKVCDAEILSVSGERSIWRVSLPPAQGSTFVDSLKLEGQAQHYYDWAGGLLWLSLIGDHNASVLRDKLKSIGGHATLVRSAKDVEDAKSPQHPLESGEHALMKRIKDNFDPKAILNPGRLYADL
ncbi:glycolate oxidase subunit GlcE [Kiloniella majae]|uniref:glycolate oxidase subunit GlcE n=1 Tax=Kiloniella majae TaxID=1938558 RepID=UPI000A279669|nr:glycolate oxidase subunit GlcE [Kiloniella majae]